MDTQCDHTLYHADRQGRLQGSWTEELVIDPDLGRRIRIVCGSCGKFYGYLRDGTSEASQALARAAIDQAAKLPPQEGNSQVGAQPFEPAARKCEASDLCDKIQIDAPRSV